MKSNGDDTCGRKHFKAWDRSHILVCLLALVQNIDIVVKWFYCI